MKTLGGGGHFNFGCSATHSEECPVKGNRGKIISLRKIYIHSLQPTKSVLSLVFVLWTKPGLIQNFWLLQVGVWNSNWVKTWILTYILADWLPVFHPGSICREIHRCCSPFHSSQVFQNFKMKNELQHTKSDSDIRGFQQINVSSEISKTSSTCYSIPVALEPITNYCPYSIIRARDSANN